MLRPSSITATLEAILSQLESQNDPTSSSTSTSSSPFTHTALISILDSAQIYACASNHSNLKAQKRKRRANRNLQKSTASGKTKGKGKEKADGNRNSSTNSAFRSAKNLLSPTLSPKSSFFSMNATTSSPFPSPSINQLQPTSKVTKPKPNHSILFGKGLMIPHSKNAQPQFSSSSSDSRLNLTGEERNQCLAAVATMAWRDEMNRVQRALNSKKESQINGGSRRLSEDKKEKRNSHHGGNENVSRARSNTGMRKSASQDQISPEITRLTELVKDSSVGSAENGRVDQDGEAEEMEANRAPWIVPAGMKIGRGDRELDSEEEVVPLLVECEVSFERR